MNNQYSQYLLTDERQKAAVEEGLLATYFSDYDPSFLTSQEGLEDRKNNVYRRYNHALAHVVPWIARHCELKRCKILEIGCGTGSSTAALAHFSSHVSGYDIHELSVLGAMRRMDVLGIDNVSLNVVAGKDLLDQVATDPNGPFDLILLFAVLEHQTVIERQSTLRRCWEMLGQDGLLVVVDTPNLLCYFDAHTSRMPFLHLLPSRLYARYASRSKREGFNTSFTGAASMDAWELEKVISRWGRGVSYHDFELAMGKDYGGSLVAHGFEEEILGWFPVSVEEALLRWYVQEKSLPLPLGLTRWVLNLIFRKGYTGASLHAPPPGSHIFLTMEELEDLRSQLRLQEQLARDILTSKTYRLGDFLVSPLRKLREFFSRERC